MDNTHWSKSDFYTFLVHHLPAYTDDPFSENPTINVQRLRKAAGRSHEGIYKWLRGAAPLKPDNAKLLVKVANSPENLDALRKMDRKPPKIEDFVRFIFA